MDRNETIADIVAEMRGIYIREWQDLADRIEAAANRETVAGNAAKLREALEKIAAWGPDPFIEPVNGDSSAMYENARHDENGKFLGREIPAWWGVAWRNDLKEFVALAKAALSAPPRNCDLYQDCNSAWKSYNQLVKRERLPCFDKWLFEAAQEGGDHAD